MSRIKIKIIHGNPKRWYKDLEGKILETTRFLNNGEAVCIAGKAPTGYSGLLEGAVDLTDFEIVS